MASAIITNWNRLRIAVSRDSCCSIDSTSASIAVTNSSAAATDSAAVRGGRASHCAAPLGPELLDLGELDVHITIPGHEQGARGIALAQQQQAFVEQAHQRIELSGRQAGLHRAGQPPGLHAHAPGFVDGSGAAFELPGHPQSQADGRQRHQQQAGADADQLGRKGGGAEHAPRLTVHRVLAQTALCPSLHRHALGQVARLVHVRAPRAGRVIRQQLQRHHVQQRADSAP